MATKSLLALRGISALAIAVALLGASITLSLSAENRWLDVLYAAILYGGFVPSILTMLWHRDVFNPQIYFPPIFVLVSLSPYLLDAIPESGYQPYFPMSFLDTHRTEYLLAIALALVGLQLGLRVIHSNVPRNQSFRLPDSGVEWVYRVLMLLGIAALWATFALNGLSSFFSDSYGDAAGGQRRSYDLGYTLGLFFDLVATPAAFAYMMPRIARRKADLWIVVYLVLGIIPLTWWGRRGPIVGLLFVAIVFFNYVVRRIRIRELLMAGISMQLLISFFMLFRRARTLETAQAWIDRLIETPALLFADTLRTVASTGWTLILTMELPDYILPPQKGLTYLGAIVNLVPTAFVGSAYDRVILAPRHLWALAAFPGSGHGKGLSAMTEAYMNWGIHGMLPVFFVIGVLLSYFYTRLRSGNYVALVFYAMLSYRTLYFLRGDSNQYVKILTYTAAVLLVSEVFGRILTKLSEFNTPRVRGRLITLDKDRPTASPSASP